LSHDAAIAAACGAGVCAHAAVGVEEERRGAGALGQKIGKGEGGMIEGDLEASSVTSCQDRPVSLTPLDGCPPPPYPPPTLPSPLDGSGPGRRDEGGLAKGGGGGGGGRRGGRGDGHSTARVLVGGGGGGHGCGAIWRLNRQHKMLFHQWVLGLLSAQVRISQKKKLSTR
jgi:hypothetical protein